MSKDRLEGAGWAGDRLTRWRGLLGQSTRLWAGAGAGESGERSGGVTVEATRWSALSGASTVEYNTALCHGESDGRDVQRTLSEIAEVGAPAVVMFAGKGLGEVQAIVDAGWVCIGSTPLMAFDLPARAEVLAGGAELQDGVRELTAEEAPRARAVLADAFDLTTQLTELALPDEAFASPGCAVWGLFESLPGGKSATLELVSCVASVTVAEVSVGWSMATPARFRRRGYGSRLIQGVMAESARTGIETMIVTASALGAPLYRRVGWREVEHWQMWSRPRWVLGRA